MENNTATKTRITDRLEARKVTLYFRGGMGYAKIEARAFASGLIPYAQYSSAVEFAFLGKGQRLARGAVQTFQPSLLVLEGWGHPEPGAVYGAEEVTASGAIVRRGRFSACSPGWTTEFDAMIAAHIATGAKVVADYRGHDPHAPAVAA